MQDWYKKYTPLNFNRDNIYQNYANIEFRKGRIQPAYPIRETSQTYKLKYYSFHKYHDHNNEDFI